jgi:uncharacterized membrane protein
MKIILIVIGSLAGLYAAFGVVQFIGVLLTSDAAPPYWVSQIVLCLVPVLLGLIVCLACFQAAFRKRKPPKK